MDLISGFLLGILLRGQNLLLCKFLLSFDHISGVGEQKSLREHPLWKKATVEETLSMTKVTNFPYKVYSWADKSKMLLCI